MQANIFIQTSDIGHEEWLSYRRLGCGGSDAAAIAGVNPWKSPISVYFEKIGEAPEIEENERMYWGNVLEDVVAKEFAKRTGFKVQRRNAMYQHKEHEFMLANVDRVYIKDGHVAGILECKTTNEYSKDQWEDDKIPNHYYLQVQHYLAVTGFQEAYIAALIGGNKFVYKKINRDEELIEYLIKIEADFWKMVQDKTPPAMDGSSDADNILSYLYPESEPEKEIHLDTLEDKLKDLERIKADIKELDKQKKEIEQTIKNEMEDAEIAHIGERKVTWKTVISNRIDSKKLKKEKPEIYEQYCKESKSRRFQIK
ncbi:YqaJ viral recombinase family protein [Garciella nitratireducens]|uniref:Putative phage-type endonuclease n=1 Tax=Garciella nitratireducens DSM 15102 TaxID=1121911 RepID=A0A1T4K7A8_9FIRM|nr:YqaJ viral recombinase family protein [Garciella nitratireducens]SJZ38291.1 putative phage-type endonuclease [Garciella nitratireducens DSM 15102]